MATSMKSKPVTYTNEQKKSVLQTLDKDESITKIASEMGVNITTIKDWRKNKKN